MTVLEYLERTLQPRYVGWQDQYKAVLYALNIPSDRDIRDVQCVIDLLEGH